VKFVVRGSWFVKKMVRWKMLEKFMPLGAGIVLPLKANR
jgi:hypothetical protein